MFLILFVVACLTQLPQDTEVPCVEAVFYQGSTAFCEGATLDINLHFNADLQINDVRFFDGRSWRQIYLTYHDSVYNTDLYHFSDVYESSLDSGLDSDSPSDESYTCSDFSSINFVAYPFSKNGSYDFTLNVNQSNRAEE